MTAGASLVAHSGKIVADVLPTILARMMVKFDKGLLRNASFKHRFPDGHLGEGCQELRGSFHQ